MSRQQPPWASASQVRRRRAAITSPPILRLPRAATASNSDSPSHRVAVAVAIATGVLLLAACTPTAQPHPAPATTTGTSTRRPVAVAASTSWRPPADASAAAAQAGLPMLGQEMLAVHYHAHLDVRIADRPITVPAGLGIDLARQRIAPLHTHDASGVIHIESQADIPYTLGQLFTEWGQPLSAHQIGPHRLAPGEVLRVFRNGQPVTGDPAALRFGACQPVWDRSAGKLLRRLRWVEGLVDPHLSGKLEGLGWLADEPLGMGGVGAVQDHGAGIDDLLGAAVVHVGRGQQRDPRVVVLVVVPAEEPLAEAAGVLDRAEPLREGGMLLSAS